MPGALLQTCYERKGQECNAICRTANDLQTSSYGITAFCRWTEKSAGSYKIGRDNNMIDWEANCQTTAMGIMPHTDIQRALELVFEMDIPYWPQLPKVTYYEDMYAQVSEGFPGISIDVENERVNFDTSRFIEDLSEYSEKMDNLENFALSPEYSVVFHKFLDRELAGYPSVRGQSTGPVSFGFKIVDENLKPVIYNEDVKSLLYDFIQKKVNSQLEQMLPKNKNAFVWVDEPGLGWVFNSLSGYNDVQARYDYRNFMAGIEGIKAIHLCANVNLPYLLDLGLEMVSFDAYQIELMPKGYAEAVADFIKSGGVISWGIVPTNFGTLDEETPESLAQRTMDYWQVVCDNTSITAKQIAHQSLVAPARCCLKNIEVEETLEKGCDDKSGKCGISSIEERTVEKAFECLKQVSFILKDRYKIYS